MPRKPQPPSAVFRIEGLSTGDAKPMFDDFTGEVIPQARGKPVMMTPDTEARERQQAKAAYYKGVLIVAGMGEHVGWVAPPKPPMLAYNQRRIKIAGEEKIMTVRNGPIPPWRRV